MTTSTNKRHWEARELVLVGVFAAAAKLSSLLIALAGGGMNPVGLIAKNLVYTTLMIVLLTKVPKHGTLLLFTAVALKSRSIDHERLLQLAEDLDCALC